MPPVAPSLPPPPRSLQFIAVLVITAWSGFWMVVLFGSLKLIGQLRVPLEEEAVGLDMAVCGTGTSVGSHCGLTAQGVRV